MSDNSSEQAASQIADQPLSTDNSSSIQIALNGKTGSAASVSDEVLNQAREKVTSSKDTVIGMGLMATASFCTRYGLSYIFLAISTSLSHSCDLVLSHSHCLVGCPSVSMLPPPWDSPPPDPPSGEAFSRSSAPYCKRPCQDITSLVPERNGFGCS